VGPDHNVGDDPGPLSRRRLPIDPWRTVADSLPDVRRIGYRRVNVRWVTPLGEETASIDPADDSAAIKSGWWSRRRGSARASPRGSSQQMGDGCRQAMATSRLTRAMDTRRVAAAGPRGQSGAALISQERRRRVDAIDGRWFWARDTCCRRRGSGACWRAPIRGSGAVSLVERLMRVTSPGQLEHLGVAMVGQHDRALGR
jgi:hypothetical protein